MKNELLRTSIEDMPVVIDWDLNQLMGVIFEVPARDVQPILPPGLHALEARPGVAMMFLGYNSFNPGNVIEGQARPAFQEVTRFFLVQPDLSIDMPVPRFTFFVHRIGANDSAFVRQEIELLHLPAYDSDTLRVELSADNLEARAVDKFGPVQDLINTAGDAVYREEEFYGQYYSVQDGKLYLGVWYCSGEAFIHQKAGNAGGNYSHPFLNQVGGPVGPSLDRRPYMQLMGRYGAPARQVFYKPRFIRDLPRAAAAR